MGFKKAKAHSSEDESMGEEEVYEVKRIKKHERRDQDGKSYLFYKVQWQGYERPEDDTWEPETNVNETAMDIVDKYWSKVAPNKQAQRYDTKTAKGKAAARRASRSADNDSAIPKKRGRSSTSQLQPDSDDEAEKPASKRKSRTSATPVASANKKQKKAPTPEPATASEGEEEEEEQEQEEREEEEEEVKEVVKKVKRVPKKAKLVEPESEEEKEEKMASDEHDQEDEIPEGEGYDGTLNHKDWEELDYASLKKWESLIEAIETVEQDENGFKFWVVWKQLDNVASWVPNKVCRERCPLKLLDFYENHLRFQGRDDAGEAVVDASAQEDN